MPNGTTMSEDEALAHITRLRDLAINLIREKGKWERVGDTPVIVVKDHGNLSLTYLTPFQRPKTSTALLGYALEIFSRSVSIYGLVMGWNQASHNRDISTRRLGSQTGWVHRYCKLSLACGSI